MGFELFGRSERERADTNRPARHAFWLGLSSIPVCLYFFLLPLGALVSLAAVILGVQGLRRARNTDEGIGLAIFGILFALIPWLLILALALSSGDNLP